MAGCTHDLALLRLLWLDDEAKRSGDIWGRVQCRLCLLTIDMPYATYALLRTLAPPHVDYDPYGLLRGTTVRRTLPDDLTALDGGSP